MALFSHFEAWTDINVMVSVVLVIHSRHGLG